VCPHCTPSTPAKVTIPALPILLEVSPAVHTPTCGASTPDSRIQLERQTDVGYEYEYTPLALKHHF